MKLFFLIVVLQMAVLARGQHSTQSSVFFVLDTTNSAVLDPAQYFGKDSTRHSFRLRKHHYQEIAALLQTAVMQYRSKTAKSFAPSPLPLQNYSFQLIPFIDNNGKKMVYINGLVLSSDGGSKTNPLDNRSKWRTTIVTVDGGGNKYFHCMINLSDHSDCCLEVNAGK